VTYGDRHGESGRFTFTLSRGEVEVFHIRATTSQSRCRWTATLLLIVDGQREMIHVDDDGEAFRTSATNGLPRWAWIGDRWENQVV